MDVMGVSSEGHTVSRRCSLTISEAEDTICAFESLLQAFDILDVGLDNLDALSSKSYKRASVIA